MVKILKFPFEIADRVTINMPENAKILYVQLQDGRPTIWAMISTLMPMENREFLLYDTGEEIKEGGHYKKYVATLQWQGLVKHIFEV